MSFPLPPTRAVGNPNPPGDMNQVVTAITGMGATYAMGPSGDATGATDANLMQSLATTIGSSGGRITMAPGQYYLEAGTVVITEPGVYIQGAGQWATVINGVGNGTLVRMYSTAQYVPHSANLAGGGISGITFDGASMGGTSAAVHVGDIYNLAVDFGARYFGSAASIGAWFDNNYHWTEQLHGRVWAENNATNVVFDNSTNAGSAATGSFDRMVLDVFLNQNGLGNGVVFQNGANLIDGRLGIYGNFTGGGASKYYVLTLTGSNASGASLISDSVLNVGCELNTLASVVPGTVNFGSSATNTISNCTGIMDFAADDAFAVSNNGQGSFEFDGPVYGDGTLQSSGALGQRPFKYSGAGGGGNLASGDTITTRFSAIIEVTTNANVTGVILQGFNPDNWRTITVMNNGTGTITFAAQATSHVQGGASNVVAANGNAVFTWNSDLALWFMATPPSLPDPGTYLAPTGATGETFPRSLGINYFQNPVSETVYASAIGLPAGTTVNNITTMLGGSAFTTANVTHGWYALLDSSRIVRAVSADQTGGNWGTTFTSYTLPMGSAYTTTYSGAWYTAFCITYSGNGGEFVAGPTALGGITALAPILGGSSSTGQTTPPSVGSTLATITSVVADRFYAFTS